jgi:hypothetical protein
VLVEMDMGAVGPEDPVHLGKEEALKLFEEQTE